LGITFFIIIQAAKSHAASQVAEKRCAQYKLKEEQSTLT